MKLSFVGGSQLNGRGGTETVLIEVLNRLSHSGNEVRLILSKRSTNMSWINKIDGSVKIIYPARNNPLSRMLFLTSVCLSSSKDEIFIVLGVKIIKFFSIARRYLHRKIKIVSWIHFSFKDQDMFDPSDILNADTHLAINSKIKDELMRMGVRKEKIFLIYNPVEKHDILMKNDEREKRNLLYVGRLQKDGQKNLKELFSAVKKSKKSVILHVYGSGEDKEKCQRLCKKLKISKRIIWHGWVDNVWTDIDFNPFALILTSKFEGLPMVFLEAMSRGIPCISANFEGCDDVIINGINGESYQSGNVTECAKLIDYYSNLKLNIKEKREIQESIDKFYPDQYFIRLQKALNSIEKGVLL